MQPLLLLKQTLEAPYDPGPLMLDGPLVAFSSGHQMLSRAKGGTQATGLDVGLSISDHTTWRWPFVYERESGLRMPEVIAESRGTKAHVTPGHVEAHVPVPNEVHEGLERLKQRAGQESLVWQVQEQRCFVNISAVFVGEHERSWVELPLGQQSVDAAIRGCIHVSGNRGNPRRVYAKTPTGPWFTESFESYAASILEQWQRAEPGRLEAVAHGLRVLKLARLVEARRVSEVHIEVLVNRLPAQRKGTENDLISIADVGFGVSQVLPVVVALLLAEPGRLVYVEQPEIHLHPRAQVELAKLLVAAANRGVRVVAETHSDLLLLGIRRMIAEGRLNPASVKLHWFERGANGVTKVTSRDVDEAGAWGDWPEDFADVRLQEQMRYFREAEARLPLEESSPR
jgi:hypothetical protein